MRRPRVVAALAVAALLLGLFTGVLSGGRAARPAAIASPGAENVDDVAAERETAEVAGSAIDDAIPTSRAGTVVARSRCDSWWCVLGAVVVGVAVALVHWFATRAQRRSALRAPGLRTDNDGVPVILETPGPPGTIGRLTVDVSGGLGMGPNLYGLAQRPKVSLNGWGLLTLHKGRSALHLHAGLYAVVVGIGFTHTNAFHYGKANLVVEVLAGRTTTVYYRVPAIRLVSGAIGLTPQRTPGKAILAVLVGAIVLPLPALWLLTALF